MTFHPEIDQLLELREHATPGVWGPTTAPPASKGNGEHSPTFHFGVEGERGEPTWGAVVSDQDPRPGIDHDRYAHDTSDYYWEPGTDIYGGTLVGESFHAGNGEYIAAIHNALPGLTQTIRNLRSMVLSVGVNKEVLDQVITDSMKGEDA